MITGSNGYLGSALAHKLGGYDSSIRCVVRKNNKHIQGCHSAEIFAVGDINSKTDWSSALNNVDIVVHLAARVHVMHDSCSSPLETFRDVNRDGTRILVEQSALRGVKRFIYLKYS